MSVHRWIASIGLDDTAYGTHPMRRTKASLIYRRTENLRAVRLLLGHTKPERVRCDTSALKPTMRSRWRNKQRDPF
jgi:hypothetical protein